jgi:dihydrofolate reductase / thymidylate synthase
MLPHQHWILACVDKDLGIAKEGQIPWRNPEDLRWFKEKTMSTPPGCEDHYLVMGRKTWSSLPRRPLPGRKHVIFSSSKAPTSENDEHVLWITNENEFQTWYTMIERPSCFYWIGGVSIWNLYMDLVQKSVISYTGAYITYMDESFGCDQFLPTSVVSNMYVSQIIRPKSSVSIYISTDPETIKTCSMEIMEWRPITPSKRTEEMQYLDAIQLILKNGYQKMDRTGTGTINYMGISMRFSLRNQTLPLLTTKRVFLKGIVEELGWFLRGETDAKRLQEKDVHIWDGNASREFLDQLGFTNRETGDCGPIYGFQMRHFGAVYQDCHTDYTGQGIDQIAYVLDQIQQNPNSRRIVLNMWNPMDLSKMVLPPCHVLYQFIVEGEEISCSMYQRSGDMGLGVPFNIASASLLTHWIAHITGKKTKELYYTIGDAHIYMNHVEALEQQIRRIPRSFPRLSFVNSVDSSIDMKKSIGELSMKQVKIHGYYPYGTIAMKMAV